MKKFKLDKNMSRRMGALVLASFMFANCITLSGCSNENNSEGNTSIEYNLENDMVNSLQNNIKKLFPEMNDSMLKNSTIMLLLEQLSEKDENGKINADVISNFKSKIDSDNMMNEFNAFLATLENTITENKKMISISSILPDEQKEDSTILSKIEEIVSNIIDSTKKEEIVSEFNKLYTLFVEEDEVEIDGVKFEIRDLDYSLRAVATSYARAGAYFSRNYITEKQYSKIDDRTNDQNNKSEIKIILEVLSNNMNEVSEINVEDTFNKKYEELTTIVNLEDESAKNLVNYMNLKYLDSDKVATKDKNIVLGEYEDSKVSNAILSVDVIFEHSYKNQNNIIPFSNLLINEYKNTDIGKIDKIALDFVQYNSIMLLNTIKEESTKTEVLNNPYFQNIYKYLTKQNFTHKYNEEEVNVVWQEISDGANFVNNEIILYTLNKLPKLDIIDNYKEVSQENLTQSIQYIQNTIMGECEKVDYEEYKKVK